MNQTTKTLNCPACRHPFDTDKPVNFVLSSERTSCPSCINIPQETRQSPPTTSQDENCVIHHCQIDLFCQVCANLMCSHCTCVHVGCKYCIISIDTMRKNLHYLFGPYDTMAKRKQDFITRLYLAIKDMLKKEKDIDMQTVEEMIRRKIEEARLQKEASIKKAEDEAKVQAQEFQAEQARLICEANETECLKVKEAESEREILIQQLSMEIDEKSKVLLDSSKPWRDQINDLQNLCEMSTDTLSDIKKIYDLSQKQSDTLILLDYSQENMQDLLSIDPNEKDLFESKKLEIEDDLKYPADEMRYPDNDAIDDFKQDVYSFFKLDISDQMQILGQADRLKDSTNVKSLQEALELLEGQKASKPETKTF